MVFPLRNLSSIPIKKIVASANENALNIILRAPTSDDYIKVHQFIRDDSNDSGEAIVEELPVERAQALLSRLGPRDDEDISQEFHQREKSLKPPNSYNEISVSFPPNENIELPEEVKRDLEIEHEKELKILRYTPEEDVEFAVSRLTITFSQPMCPITSIDKANENIPATITPQVDGRWIWLGTKTIAFEPKPRFNFSTKYTISISKGLKSMNGGELLNNFSFSFSTPTLNIKSSFPTGSHHNIENLIGFIEFDQRINPDEIVKYIKVNNQANSVSLISHEQVELNLAKQLDIENKFTNYFSTLRNYLKNNIPKQHLFFSIEGKFEKSSTINITISNNAPSAEGPLLNRHDLTYSFSTYPLFKINNHYSGGAPYSPWIINFSNDIDLETLDIDMHIKVTPKINYKVNVYSNRITINPESKGKTEYQVIFSDSIKDIYGQNLHLDSSYKFQVGSATVTFRQMQPSHFIWDHTLSNNEVPQIDFTTVNIKEIHVKIYQIEANQFPNYSRYLYNSNYYRDIIPLNLLKLAGNEIIQVKDEQDTPIFSKIELAKYLQHPDQLIGHLLVVADADSYKSVTWVQCTKIAIDAFTLPNNGILVWVNSLADGSPISNASIITSNGTISVDSTGVAHLLNYNSKLIIAKCGIDSAFINNIHSYENSLQKYRLQIFDDRGLYRPKEEINFKVFIRELKPNGPTISFELPKGLKIKWKLSDSRYVEYLSGISETNDWGSLSISIKSIPDNVNLGNHNLILSLENDSQLTTHHFNVQEFRTPEFKISASVPPKNYVVGSITIAKVNAEYYSGGSLSGAKAFWNVTQAYTSYYPPGFPLFNFQSEIVQVSDIKTLELKTNDSGESEITIDFTDSSKKCQVPVLISASCSVQDMNYQTINSSTSFIVHPSTLYVGIKTKKYFITKGSSLEYQLVVCDIDGNEKKNVDVIMTLRKETTIKRGYKEVTKNIVVKEEVITFKDSESLYSFNVDEGGLYTLTANIEDSQGRSNNSQLGFFVSGGISNRFSRNTRIQQSSISMIANQKNYLPNETAKILVQSPIKKSVEGIMIVTCRGVVKIERFQLDTEGCKVLSVDIKEEFVPNLTVTVYLVGSDIRIDNNGEPILDPNIPLKPAFAKGTLTINISKYMHELKAKINVEDVVKPGSTIPIEIQVRDYKENPVKNAEVTLVIADEAILSLTGYSISNPINMIQYIYSDTGSQTNRTNIYVKEIDTEPFPEFSPPPPCPPPGVGMARTSMMFMAQSMPAPPTLFSKNMDTTFGMSQLGGNDQENTPIQSRTEIKPLAAFIPNLITNEDGIVNALITLPDNLTQFRISAVFVHGADQFGYQERKFQTLLPISVRPSIPRFLNFGDRNVNFSVILQNQFTESINVEVAVLVKNLKISSGTGGFKVIIPALKRASLIFPIDSVLSGKAEFEVAASIIGTSFSDAAKETIDVFTPSVSEAFATYGELDDGAISQTIVPPSNVLPQFGGLEISTSSTAIGSLTDCFLYLIKYPYLCSEQIASRLIGIVTLYDILLQFNSSLVPKPYEIKESFKSGMDRLQKMQLSNGGFSFWEGGSHVSFFNSVHVAHALVRCANDGKDVPLNLYNNAIIFINNLKNHLNNLSYDFNSIVSLRAYAIYVLSQMKEKQFGVTNQSILTQAKELYNECKNKINLDGEVMAWLCSAFRICSGSKTNEEIELLKKITNRFNETSMTANFISSITDNGEGKMVLLHSSLRTDAIILDMLLTVDPKNNIIPKFVKGLDNRKNNGIFRNTQENNFALIALRRYFDMFESKIPDFTTKTWISDDYIGEFVHKGRNTEIKKLNVPMKEILKNESSVPQKLILYKIGSGRMYYRLGMTYAPKDLNLDSVSYGFTIRRKYEAVSSPSHVKQLEDGTWQFIAGELIKVTLTISNDSRRYHVAIVDKLPSGLEIINTSLHGQNVLESVNKFESHRYWNWWSRWYDHQNLRTERVEVFSQLLWEGTHEYSYICRATASGDFVIPPCQAEEMYSPEIFGRTKYEKVKIIKE